MSEEGDEEAVPGEGDEVAAPQVRKRRLHPHWDDDLQGKMTEPFKEFGRCQHPQLNDAKFLIMASDRADRLLLFQQP